MRATEGPWPSLPLAAWRETHDTLHLWTQVVGKVRLALAPYVNHWWNVALQFRPRGLTTGSLHLGARSLEIAFDFVDHVLTVDTDAGARRTMALAPRSVADFHGELRALLGSLGLDVAIDPRPQELAHPIPFDRDEVHAAYDFAAVERWWRLMSRAERLLQRFRGGYCGKCSPVHFFWGSFDIAVTRFSGRRAPPRPGADRITRLAYSHEVLSAGFWPGSANVVEPAFYAYAAPEPAGFREAPIEPRLAFYNPTTQGWILRVSDLATAGDPDDAALEFCESTYRAGATLAGWDRAELEEREAPPALTKAA